MRFIKLSLVLLFTACALLTYAQAPEGYPANYARAPRFKALVYYTQHAEEAHVQFAKEAAEFFRKLNYGNGFILETTTDFSQYPYEKLKEYNVVVMLNTSPGSKAERDAFEKYMENGGGVEVLLSISPKNYPLGIKDVVNFGDFPIVWTNKNYRMIYLNMGHGDEEFIDGTQNLLLVNAFRWVVSRDKEGNPFLK